MSEVFLKIVNMSISAGWLILAVLALRLLLKKAPKWVNVLLWGIVAVRLICPFSIESALSLIPSTETISPEIMLDWTPEISTGIEPLNKVVNPIITASFAPEPLSSANPLQILIPVWANIWLLGILAMLLYSAVSYLSLRKKVSTAVILRDNIFQSENVSAPFVLGILKPRIYLPFKLDGQNLEHVVAHERAHIRRRDHWWKPLGFLLLTIHWFNPLMWIAYILLCRDIELACDEKVIKELGNEQRADYTQALVACSVNRRMIAACPLAFGEVGVKERVISIMNYRKPAFWIIVAAVVACVVVAVCFLTDPPVPSLEVLPLVHSHSYGVVEVIYEGHRYSMVDRENTPIYAITSNMELLSKRERSSEAIWKNLGTLTEIELTRNNFDDLFYDKNGWYAESSSYIRENTVNAWSVIDDQDVMYYLLQLKNGELFLAQGYYDYAGKNVPGSDNTTIHWLYRIAIDMEQERNVIAASGENAVPITIFPAGTAIGNYENAIHWLTISPDDDQAPFSTYMDGEELNAIYIAYETETYEPIQYFIPSGRAPQTFLFQNADQNREYIVVMKLSLEPDALIYCFGVRFAEQEDSVLQAKILEIHDGYFLVQPVEGSWELSSADRIEVPMQNMSPSPEPQAGDIIEIRYNGEIMETYPAKIGEVYSIRVIGEDDGKVTMVPTSANMSGLFDSYLYLTIDGATYRYERQTTDTESVEAGELIDTLYENTGFETYSYDVYSVAGCDDLSMVLAVNTQHGGGVYRYSPSKRCDDSALQEAKVAGYVVMEDGDVTSGQESWLNFYETTRQGKGASITVAHYHTLDPDGCTAQYYEAYKEDYPCLFLLDLTYDGEKYTLSWNEYGTQYVRTYEYLMRYVTNNYSVTSSALPENTLRYVLTHDNKVTWEDLINGLYSSQSGAYIDHYSIYTDRE